VNYHEWRIERDYIENVCGMFQDIALEFISKGKSLAVFTAYNVNSLSDILYGCEVPNF
jgi:hypothetical protein